jgi:UDP-glucose:glycoprotein glucosyltransferase
MPLNEVLADPQWDSKLVATRAYLDRLGVDLVSTRESNALGSFFLNGAYSVLDEVSFESVSSRRACTDDSLQEFTSVLQRTIQSHTQFLQQQIYLADLTAAKDSSTYFYDLPTTYKRRNRHIFPSPEENPLVVVNLVEALQGVDDVLAKDTFVGGGESRPAARPRTR